MFNLVVCLNRNSILKFFNSIYAGIIIFLSPFRIFSILNKFKQGFLLNLKRILFKELNLMHPFNIQPGNYGVNEWHGIGV